MCGKVIFVAGAYGVGKSTFCNKVSESLNIPSFSSGDLISEKNGEKYGANKTVKNKENNQKVLINAVKEKIAKSPKILLAGHFCIFDAHNKVEFLPEFVYKELDLSKIILLEADANTIIGNLQKRDNKKYTVENINELLAAESLQAHKIAIELNIPIVTHRMNFNQSDFEILKSIIEGSET